jgi:glycosyltransferase involved in cell wall biosynthesis
VARPGLTFGIDARAAVEEVAGRGRVVRELLRALALRDDGHRYVLFARSAWPAALGERFEWRIQRSPDPWWNLRAALAAGDCDAFLSSNSYLTTWFLRVPGVPIVYDMVAFDAAMRPSRRSSLIERLTMTPAVRRSAGFVAISRATRDAFLERYPSAAPRTVVAPLAVSSELASVPEGEPGLDLPSGFVLAVGTLEPRKNLPRLAAAYLRLPRELQEAHPLVVVGRTGWETGDTFEGLRSLGSRAKLLGAVPDATLAELYRRCGVFCYPSLGEGFGLPVLEAMSAGAAVITSNRSSLPEVGGDAVDYVNPLSVDEIAAALQRLLQDPERRRLLGERGRARAAEFSWDRFAEITLGALTRAARP